MSGHEQWIRRAWIAMILLAMAGIVAPPARSQDRPEGMIVGPWVLSPYFASDYSYDTNVFRDSETGSERDSDSIVGVVGGLEAVLPFKMSSLTLGYEARDEEYGETDFERTTAQEASVELELNFSTGDSLTLSDEYTRDYARVEDVDSGGELVFDGKPYNLNQWEVNLSRRNPRQQGYLIRIRRKDLIYDSQGNLSFFQYRGFDNVFEFRQPLPGKKGWTVAYRTRRFNHYRAGDPDKIGVPFRKEETDSVLIGLRGRLGDAQPYQAHIGFARFRYKEVDSSDFDGIVGRADWRVRLGGRTDLELLVVRQPLPSDFDTFYINNGVRAKLVREWRRFEGGADLRLSRNLYGDALDPAFNCSGKRRDFSYDAGTFWEWKIHERFSFEVAAYHYDRSSNCAIFEYTATEGTAGFTLGWF